MNESERQRQIQILQLQRQRLELLQQQATAPPPQQQQMTPEQMALEGVPWYEKMAIGAGRGALETWEGARQLVDMGSPENQAMLDVKMPSDPFVTGGYIGGEIAQLVAPFAAVPKMGRMAMAATDVGLSAAQAGLKAPTDERGRLENAAYGAGGAVLGQGIAQSIGHLVRPKMSTAAQALVDAGVPLTPGQAHGGWRAGIESRIEALPFIGTATNDAKAKALDAWNKTVLEKVAPTGAVKEIGHRGIKEISEQFDTAYRGLEEGLELPITGEAAQAFRSMLGQKGATYGPMLTNDQQQVFSKELGNLYEKFDGKVMTGSNIKPEIADLRRLETAAINRGDVRLADAYGETIGDLRSFIYNAAGAADRLPVKAALDQKYSHFKGVQRAAAYIGAEGGRFTPRQALSAIRANDGSLQKSAFARGTLPNQGAIEEAGDIFGNALPSPGPGTAEKAIFALGAMVDPVTTAGAYPVSKLMPAARGFMVERGLPTIGASSQVGEAALNQAVPQAPQVPQVPENSAARSLAGIIPPRLTAPLQGEDWFTRWAMTSVKPSHNTPRSHAVRLQLASKGQQLTKAQKKAVDQLTELLKTLHTTRGN